MINFRKKYFIHSEIQKPLIIVFLSSFFILVFIQLAAFYGSIVWINAATELNMSLIVDFQLLSIWKKMLLVLFLISSSVNMGLSIFMMIFISNRFAGPIYRLEKELDSYLSGEKKELNVNFRKTDYLQPLADKINKVIFKLNLNKE